jgi:putative flippase GtrA
VPSNVVALSTATLYNFALSRGYTFSSTSSIGRSALLYLLLFAWNQLFSATAIVFLIDAGLFWLLAKLVAMACVVCWNFVLYRTVVFK